MGKTQIHIGTLGHVDHGKTTLSAAITVYLANRGRAKAKKYDEIDAAPEIREAGITMNMAYLSYETEQRRYNHLDCPGHADYVKALLTNVARLDAGILVVSALDGPMPQTREHILLARQTGIPYLIVYLNKCDIMIDDEEMIMLIEEEIRELLTRFGYPGDTTPILRGSALAALNDEDDADGLGVISIKKLMDTLDSYIPDPTHDIDSPFLMSVEGAMYITGRGTVVTGKVEFGKVKIGDEVEILGIRETKKAVVTGTQMFNKEVPEACAGFNAGILLRDIARDDIERGMVLCKPSSFKTHRKFKASIYISKKEEGGRSTAFTASYKPQFFFRTADFTGTILKISEMEDSNRLVAMAMPGDSVCIEAELLSSVAMQLYQQFTVREGGKVIASGRITELLD